MSHKIKNIFFEKWPYSGWHVRPWFLITGIFTAVAVLIAVGFWVCISIDRHFSQQSCEARAELIGTDEYTWHDFTFFDYGCFNVSERGTTSDNYGRILIEDN